jgi:hypothetical protein
LHGCFCFVPPKGVLADVGLPPFRTLEVDGWSLLSTRTLVNNLTRPGPIGPEQSLALRAELAARLPPASP